MPIPGQTMVLTPSSDKPKPNQGPGSPLGRAKPEAAEGSEEPALGGYVWAYRGPRGEFIDDDLVTNLSRPRSRS